MNYEFSAKWLCAEMIASALSDLSATNKKVKTDALNWINENSGEVMGFRYCISVAGISPNLIQDYIAKIIELEIPFSELKTNQFGELYSFIDRVNQELTPENKADFERQLKYVEDKVYKRLELIKKIIREKK